MLRFVGIADGGGAAGVANMAHGLGTTPDWCHAEARTSTIGWRATLGNDGAGLYAWDITNIHIMVHNAQIVHYTGIAVVWQGRSY